MFSHLRKEINSQVNWDIIKVPFLYGVVVTGFIVFMGFYCDIMNNIISTYASTFRSPLLTGFITAGSFLMAIKSFSISTFKRDMFERMTEYYKFAVENSKCDSVKFPQEFMSPIEKFRKILYISILFCIISSISQVALGAINILAAFIIISIISTTTFALILKSVFTLDSVFETWFEFSKSSIEINFNKDKINIELEKQGKEIPDS